MAGSHKDGEKTAISKAEVLLQDLSQMWIKNGKVNIADLAPIWRDEQVPEIVEEVSIEFRNERIQEFYNKRVRPLRHASLHALLRRKTAWPFLVRERTRNP